IYYVLFSKKRTDNTHFCRMQAYFDHDASTPLYPEVRKAMTKTMQENVDNPSSIHEHGRQAKTRVEKARKKIAGLLKAYTSKIFFTSGGTEADNMAIVRSMTDLGITHAITSPLEHHAVLHTVEDLAQRGIIQLDFVRVDEQGNVDLDHLRELLSQNPRTF